MPPFFAFQILDVTHHDFMTLFSEKNKLPYFVTSVRETMACDRILINLARRQLYWRQETTHPSPDRGGEEEKGKIWGEIIHKIQHTNTKIFGSY
ncbi:MAG: hypothetical protein F6K24_30030 [Okeania sp. SIO2D1]|nr:hypothetical protein [Okeania sp. SIO2D1]